MRQIKVSEVLTVDEQKLVAEWNKGYLKFVIDKEVNAITLGELRAIGAALSSVTSFSYEPDFLRAAKKMYNAITQTF